MQVFSRGISAFCLFVPLASAGVIASPSYTARSNSDPGGIAFQYVDITATGTVLFSNEDDTFTTLSLGAPFTFFGETGTQAIVTSNGVITFQVGNLEFLNDNLPTNTFSYRSLFPYWDDLFTSAYYQYFAGGAGPFSGPVSVIEWVGGYCSTGLSGCSAGGTVSFETLIEHATGRILYQYSSTKCPQGACAAPHDNGASVTVGIQSLGGSNAEALEWSFNSAVIADQSTILFTPNGAVPEPSSMLLIGGGLLALGSFRRRR